MIEVKRAVTRRTIAPVTGSRGRRIVVTLYPGDAIGFREEGTRHTYLTTIGACYSLAVKQEVAATRQAKAAEKAARKKNGGAS